MPTNIPLEPRDAVFWFDRKEPPLPSLQNTVTADVAVVGGGMMGLMCARTLVTRGCSVCLIEADTCGGAASGRSSGFITPDSELEFQDLIRQFGRDDARKLWDFAVGGVRLIRDAIAEAAIDCDAQVQDALIVASSARDAQALAAEHARREAAGYASTWFSRGHVPTVLGSSAYFGALRFTGTFGIDAYRCCAGLRRDLLAGGVRIFERSPVTGISSCGVVTNAAEVRAPHVAVCTDRFLPRLRLARREVYHAQTFLAMSEPLHDAQVAQLFPAGRLMVWDTSLIYHYFRLTGDRRLLIGGGTLASTYAAREQHRPAEVVRRMNKYLARHLPDQRLQFRWVWPGLIGISKDFAPVVGRDVAHGHVRFAGGAAGLPWAAALGRYLAERILDGRDEFDGILSVNRKFPIGPKLQAIVGRRAAFALSHGMVKWSAR
jgi:gamma-glutamylputrescine oxidase